MRVVSLTLALAGGLAMTMPLAAQGRQVFINRRWQRH